MRVSEAWQVLGVPPAPTVLMVKRAFRALAKSAHPDAVGGGANPIKFARLTEAYEIALADARIANRIGAPLTRQTPSPRPRRSSPPPRSMPNDRSGQPRARPGSTTYDGTSATDEDQVWDGAEWVGANSGTYWRVNPKEYADPRKHGAEYRARGRRPVRQDVRRRDSSPKTESPAFSQTRDETWPRIEWRLFYGLVAWAPLLAAEPLLPGLAIELLLLGLLILAPRIAWSCARGSVALLVVALPWALAATFGLPLPSFEGFGLVATLIWAGAYAGVALLSWSGRLSPQPWVSRDAGFKQDAG